MNILSLESVVLCEGKVCYSAMGKPPRVPSAGLGSTSATATVQAASVILCRRSLKSPIFITLVLKSHSLCSNSPCFLYHCIARSSCYSVFFVVK